MSLSICVFCSASEAVTAADRAVAAELGGAVADRGWTLVYGGGDVGLMGETARAALAAGGVVTGIIPHRLADREVALEHVTELIRTDTMRERKALMDERSDAFVVLPGGIGTLEELVEILTLKVLGYHERPVVLLDPDGFWEPLRAQLDRIIERGLAGADLRATWTDANTVDEALDAVVAASPRPHEASAADRLEALQGPPRPADRRRPA